MVDYAIAHGVNYFDTAYLYHDGKSETFIGEALSKYPRELFNLATKMPLYDYANEINMDADRIFQEQLTKCKVTYFDFYLIHNMNENSIHMVEKYHIYDLLKEKQRQGYIRHLGFSFHGKPEFLIEAVNNYDWDFVQIQLNYMDWDLQNAKLQYQILKDKNIPITVMEPVRGGMLATLCKESIEIFKDANKDVSIASWALRYSASFPEVLTVLSGMSTISQVQDNTKTFEHFKPLNKQEYSIIDKALSVYRKSSIIPCTTCRYCMDCPRGVDIPGVIGIYNNYNQLGKDKRTSIQDFLVRYLILGADKQAHLGIRCNQCLRRCPQHIDIPYWMKTINMFYKKHQQPRPKGKLWLIMKNVITRTKKEGLMVTLKYYGNKLRKNKKNNA
jgi:predicted aldo/keto reductase-like oxidoreductase